MNSKLLANLSADEKEQFQYEYEKSYHYRQRVLEMLQAREAQLVSSMVDESKFGENWAYFQAERVAAIRELRALATFLK